MTRFSLLSAGRRGRSALAAMLTIGLGVGANDAARGAVTTVGAVTPVPPAGGGGVSGVMTIGDGAYGSVAITAGTGLTGTGGTTIGNAVGGIGYLSLSGYGSNYELLNSGLDMTIGDEGLGSLYASNLAKVVVPDDTILGQQNTATGKLVVTGLGTSYLNGDDVTVGFNGTGIVEILAGGLLASDLVNLGDNATGNGSALVSGDLSRWQAGGVTVGDAGTGRLEITNGGRFIAASTLQVGLLATSYGALVVDGVGSRLQAGENVNTGAGDAFITLSNGGTVSTVAISQISPTGRLTLAGGRWASSAASNAALAVAGLVQGSGVLDVQGVSVGSQTSSGRLQTRTGDHLLLTGLLTNSGLVDLAGGELEVRGVVANNGDIDARNGATLRVGGAGLDNNSGSQLAITGGAVDVFGAVDNNTGAEIAVVGGATGVFHDAVVNNGRIYVSASSEVVMLENLSFVPTSSLAVQVANLEAGDGPTDAFGLVSVGGSSTLAGTLAVSLAPGFAPTLGETFTILTAADGISGTFASESLPTLGGGLALDVQYTPNAVMLAVVGNFLPADFDEDGDVDADDLAIWKGAFGLTPLGDANGDEKTDGADFLAWQEQYGTFPAVATAAAVPEPAAALLALLAAPFLLKRRQ